MPLFQKIYNFSSHALNIVQIWQWIISFKVISTLLITGGALINFIIRKQPVGETIFYITGILCFLTVFWDRATNILQGNTINHKFNFQGCNINVIENKDNSNKFSLQIILNFMNNSSKEIYYNMDSISVIMNDKTIAHPTFLITKNTGKLLIPLERIMFIYDTIKD